MPKIKSVEVLEMLKFEQVGVEYQLSSATKVLAIKRFETSCNICCCRGIHLDCERCGIAEVHKEVIACFEDFENLKRKVLRYV